MFVFIWGLLYGSFLFNDYRRMFDVFRFLWSMLYFVCSVFMFFVIYNKIFIRKFILKLGGYRLVFNCIFLLISFFKLFYCFNIINVNLLWIIVLFRIYIRGFLIWFLEVLYNILIGYCCWKFLRGLFFFIIFIIW